MDYTVPTNWQPELVPALQGLPVAEVYGQLPRDFVGGGRASILIGRVSGRRFRAHVAEVRAAGMHFNYTLNAPTMGNREWSIRGQRAMEALLDRLVDAGVDALTVSIPYLLQWIKRRRPQLFVSVSTQALVASPDRARRWQDLGADGITLSVLDVNRDFVALRAIRKAVSLRLQLIGNLLCVQGCPAGFYHAAINALASQTGQSPFVIDYCTIECTRRRLHDPSELIRAAWIRPEDQRIYEDLGIDRIKLVTKGMRTDALVAILRAYAGGASPADLMDLFPSPDKALSVARPDWWNRLWHYARPHRANLLRLRRLGGLLRGRPIRIDSKALGDDFLGPFLRGSCDQDCDACRYCRAVAERAVHLDQDALDAALAAHDAALDDILSARLFRYGGGHGPDAD